MLNSNEKSPVSVVCRQGFRSGDEGTRTLDLCIANALLFPKPNCKTFYRFRLRRQGCLLISRKSRHCGYLTAIVGNCGYKLDRRFQQRMDHLRLTVYRDCVFVTVSGVSRYL